MPLYRADPKDGVAWVTGASTGLGRQLALDLARQGYVVAATARDEDRLVTLVDEAAGAAGRIVPFLCDVTDERGMDRTVDAIEKQLGPIVLAVFNAGIYSATHGERLETFNFVSTYQVNLLGVIYGLVPVADRMRDRGFGQVALVGSVTSYFGLPAAAAYGSSKAALNSLAQSLRYDFDKLNIRLQIVNPGFIATPLTAKNRFPMPGLMTVEDASKRMLRGFGSGGFELVFPRRVAWPTRLLSFLPEALRYRFMRRLTGWDRRRFGVKNGR
jgi:NAD(P)-dependent dehydrogenase (short-subunit alcohol dehydrogenase family)